MASLLLLHLIDDQMVSGMCPKFLQFFNCLDDHIFFALCVCCCPSIQCFGTVGEVTGRASGL